MSISSIYLRLEIPSLSGFWCLLEKALAITLYVSVAKNNTHVFVLICRSLVETLKSIGHLTSMSMASLLRSALAQPRSLWGQLTCGLGRLSTQIGADVGYEKRLYEERKNESLDQKRARLLYQSRKRGKWPLSLSCYPSTAS